MKNEAIKKILIIRIDRIGDLVCTVPSIRTLKKVYAGAELYALLSPVNGMLLENTGLVHNIIIWDKSMSSGEKKSFFQRLKEYGFDMALVFSPVTEAYSLAGKTGASIRGGVVLKSRFLTRAFSAFCLTHTYLLDQEGKISRNEPVLHEVEKGFSLLKLLGIEDFERDMTLSLPKNIRNESRELLNSLSLENYRGIIGLPLCCRYKRAGWSSADMVSLSGELRKKFPEYFLFVTFGEEEQEEGRVLENSFKNRNDIAVKGPFPLQLWASLMQSMSLVISIDSGAVHLAASGKVSVLVLYPEDIYRLCHQEWTPWQVNNRQLVMTGYEETKDNILDAVEGLLNSV